MRRSKFFRLGILVSSLILVSLAKPGSPLAEEKPVKSLYERLGGSITSPRSSTIPEVLYVDDILNATRKSRKPGTGSPRRISSTTSRPWSARRPADGEVHGRG